MATYSVKVPITGYLYVDVEAESEKEAIAAALEADTKLQDVEEWSVHEHITQGHFFYGLLNSANASKVDD